MKKIFTLKFILSTLAVFSAFILTAQTPTTHSITLTCDTTNMTKQNANDMCTFAQPSDV